ncbi:MAG: DUF2203 domain-containing protein [Leptospiraceae bacterium]|nr:DUF2203 domain-containing protein [Leptospiraceae bacterium]MDW7977050.1 DUF2203 family protein [Leptospiraceae bacterium]
MEQKKKIWTLEEAREVFPIIYKITDEYYRKVESLQRKMENILPEFEQEQIEEEIQNLIRIWIMKMIDMKVEVKGLWLIDFDHGKGYYCWKYNEPDILYEHDYESGFRGRRPIKDGI